MHPSNPQNHRHSIYPTNLPEPLFHPYQIPASSTIPTKQTPIIHRNTHADLHHQIITTHLNTVHPHPHLHPYSHSKLQPIYHTTYHPNQLSKLSQIPHTDLHLPQPPSYPYSPTTQTHTYQHHTTTTTPFPQHTSQAQPNFQHITAQT